MGDDEYNVYGKIVGAVGANSFVNQIFVTGSHILGTIKNAFEWLFPTHDQNKLMRQRLKYIKKGVEIEQRKYELQQQQFALEMQKFAYQANVDAAVAEREMQAIELTEETNEIRREENEIRRQENQIREDEAQSKREFYAELIEVFKQQQRNLIQLKAVEIQANWDLWNLSFIQSREETLRLFQKGPGLLVLLAPPQVPEEIPGFGRYIKTEIEHALNSTRAQHYSADQEVYSVDFSVIFKRPIANLGSGSTTEESDFQIVAMQEKA